MPPLHLAGIVLTTFIAPYFLIKKNRHLHDILASILLVCTGTFLLAPFFVQSGNPYLQSIPPVIPLCIAPLIYLYILSFINEKKILRPVTALHWIPAVLCYLYFVFSGEAIPGAVTDPSSSVPFTILMIGPFTALLLYVYAGYAFYSLYKFSKELELNFSEIALHQITGRLLYLLAGYMICLAIMLLLSLNFHHLQQFLGKRQTIHAVVIDLFIIIFGYVNLQSRHLPEEPALPDGSLEWNGPHDSTKKTSDNIREETSKTYEKSSIKERTLNEYQIRIEHYFNNEKPYLNERFSIYDLEKATGISRHHLAQVFSKGWKTNFYNYVNRYRIHEVISYMKNPEFKEHSLLRIALEAGFNSKASFNRVFKQITGKTPTEYRESGLKEEYDILLFK